MGITCSQLVELWYCDICWYCVNTQSQNFHLSVSQNPKYRQRLNRCCVEMHALSVKVLIWYRSRRQGVCVTCKLTSIVLDVYCWCACLCYARLQYGCSATTIVYRFPSGATKALQSTLMYVMHIVWIRILISHHCHRMMSSSFFTGEMLFLTPNR